jgi:hypothetical protein
MQSNLVRAGFHIVVAVMAVCIAAVSVGAQGSGVITGTVEKVDSGARTIAVKTADGTVETVKFTEKTSVHGLKDAAKGTDLAGKEGGHVIVHTVGEGSEKTAHSVEWVGGKTVHTTEGTVEDVGKGSKTVAVKTADGTKETFVVAGHGSAAAAKKGEHVTVYYTEEAGKKIAHVFKHL